MALIKITAGGSITVENSAGSTMTGLVFDITLPAPNPVTKRNIEFLGRNKQWN